MAAFVAEVTAEKFQKISKIFSKSSKYFQIFKEKFNNFSMLLMAVARFRGAALVAEKFQKISNFFFVFFNTELVFAKLPH